MRWVVGGELVGAATDGRRGWTHLEHDKCRMHAAVADPKQFLGRREEVARLSRHADHGVRGTRCMRCALTERGFVVTFCSSSRRTRKNSTSADDLSSLSTVADDDDGASSGAEEDEEEEAAAAAWTAISRLILRFSW